MQGADGTQIMQTINVPASVLAGASERPVLLTVTPKNGINKGQKQIVVLTKNGNSFGASVKPAYPAPSPSKVVLSQRPPQQIGSGMTQASINSILAASKPVPDISSLLAAAKPVPSSELKEFQNTLTNSPASNHQPKPTNIIPVPSSQARVSQPKPVLHPAGVTLLQTSGRTVVQQAGAGNQPLSVGHRVIQQVATQPTVSAGGQQRIITQVGGQPGQRIVQQIGGPQVTASGQRVVHTLVQPGQILPNGQQVVIRNGKPVLIPASAAAIAAQANTASQQVVQQQRPALPTNQLPAGKIVLTQKGQVIQGAQAQALAGKIINTSQGQFIIGANGQLMSTQKLIQGHTLFFYFLIVFNFWILITYIKN